MFFTFSHVNLDSEDCKQPINSLLLYRLGFRGQQGRCIVCQHGGRVNSVLFRQAQSLAMSKSKSPVTNGLPNAYEYEEGSSKKRRKRFTFSLAQCRQCLRPVTMTVMFSVTINLSYLHPLWFFQECKSFRKSAYEEQQRLCWRSSYLFSSLPSSLSSSLVTHLRSQIVCNFIVRPSIRDV